MPWPPEALAGLAAAAALHAPFPALTELRPVTLHPGVTAVAHMAPDGRDGMIVEGHRDYFTADGSHDVFLALVRGDGGQWWSVATHGSSPNDDPDDPLSFTDAPHTGEDAVASVRFARARLDGRPAFVALVAQRAMEGTIPSPSHVTFTLYRLQQRSLDDGWMFLKVGAAPGRACYGNADLALHAELNLPLPHGYEGPTAAGVCGDE